ncbi:unnamed protein product [Darwinula stevensoni]|uniref:RRM domain-containing protein n=1 Tax=Darwinula stevensoni TaxID=69355 RepID=A0A7R8X9H1_9CRUS|nr:unnamed protein product [Darwinula stevensoni]CAG0889669.1 unnamed protein product [Darwinula stevensoni]
MYHPVISAIPAHQGMQSDMILNSQKLSVNDNVLIAEAVGNPVNGLTNHNHVQLISNGSQTTPSTGANNGNGLASGGNGGGSGRSTPNNDPAPNKLFVGGLSWQTTPEKLREYFGVFGTVTDVLIMKDPMTQRSRGFGFITFADATSVDKVLQVSSHTLDGKKIDPKHATPKSKKGTTKTKKIFVGGLSQETSVEEVKQYFSQFGTVEEAVLLMDNQTKRHRGFGFVTMLNEDAVDRICEIHFHTVKGKRVECKKALPREAVSQPTPSLALLMARQRLLTAAAAGMPAGLVPAAATGVPGLMGLGVASGPQVNTSHFSAAGASALQQMGLAGATSLAGSSAACAAAAAAAATPTSVSTTQASVQAQAQALSQGGYGKLLAYQNMASAYRFSPYGVPTAAAVTPTMASNTPYMTSYALPTAFDLSSLQGVDWTTLGLPTMYAA